MCNLSVWVWVFVPGYGACGQLYLQRWLPWYIPSHMFSFYKMMMTLLPSRSGLPFLSPKWRQTLCGSLNQWSGRNDATQLLRLDHKIPGTLTLGSLGMLILGKPATKLWGGQAATGRGHSSVASWLTPPAEVLPASHVSEHRALVEPPWDSAQNRVCSSPTKPCPNC